MPRLDYSGGASCPSLLLEPQRSNLVTQSEYLLGYFATDGTTLSHNHGVSPEGVDNSVLITQTGAAASNSIYNFNLPTTDGTYSYSFFFKAGTSTLCRFYCGTGVTENFNPQNVTAGYTGGSLNLRFEDYGNDWWRVSANQTLSGASTNRFAFNPDYGNSGGNVEIYGFQIEVGRYPTSYIPAYGTSQTRSVDNARAIDYTFNGGSPFTLFFEHGGVSSGNGGQQILLYVNPLDFYFRYTSDTRVNVWNQEAGNTIVNVDNIDRSQSHKIAMVYNGNGLTDIYIDGIKRTSGYTYTWESVDYDINLSASAIVGGSALPIKQVLNFTTALTDSECIALTTIA